MIAVLTQFTNGGESIVWFPDPSQREALDLARIRRKQDRTALVVVLQKEGEDSQEIVRATQKLLTTVT